ncbi:hypothetical protein [Mesorhizobium sp. M0276]|uniref:hypothetical protein n=1 Tax=Mesorhizobium sp. M0276 TaxID=2956928 RepID=UPI003339AEA1
MSEDAGRSKVVAIATNGGAILVRMKRLLRWPSSLRSSSVRNQVAGSVGASSFTTAMASFGLGGTIPELAGGSSPVFPNPGHNAHRYVIKKQDLLIF